MVPLTQPLASCDTDANGITLPQSHVAPHVNCFDLRNAVVPLMMPVQAPKMSHDKKLMLYIILIMLTKGMKWNH